MPETTVSPYWELTFDAEGEPHPAQVRRLLAQAAQEEVTDLVFFAHGWNNDRFLAGRFHGCFFAPFPKLTAGAGPGAGPAKGKAGRGARGPRTGYVGVHWPSMRFADEQVPEFDGAPGPAPRPALDARTRRQVGAQFPGRPRTVDRIGQLLEERPEEEARREEFVRLVRHLTAAPAGSAAWRLEADTEDEWAARDADAGGDAEPAEADPPATAAEAVLPAMLDAGGATETFEEFTVALRETGGEEAVPGGMWSGGREILRQAVYHALKRRAGVVGERGLGPVLARLAAACPGTRLHLAGHGHGARLVSFALRGLPEDGPRPASVTLLQGAFSHYAFADKLPYDKQRGGVLRGVRKRVDGPLVCCHSEHDTALGALYPLASRLVRDGRPAGERYGALGHGGLKGLPSAKRLTLDEALDGPFPAKGCVSVDAARVVHRGAPPTGAHHDICHAELARLIAAAGRIG